MSHPVQRLHTITRRSGSLYGSGDSSTARNTLKMALVAPMPSASVIDGDHGKAGLAAEGAKAEAEVL